MAQPLRLITVSRLAPNKRVDHALRALADLLRSKTDARLTVVGAGEVEQPLRNLSGELRLGEHVTFTGPVTEKEKDEHLRRSHLLLHTSMREGWGLDRN